MSHSQLFRRRSFKRVPWKNGQGFTEEIVHSQTAPFLWRLSIAEVNQSGPFSEFNGYQRNITALCGDGMVLNVDGRNSPVLTPFQPYTFSGNAKTHCTLTGRPLRDFNVIYQPELNVTVTWLQAPEQTLPLSANQTLFIIAGEGVVEVTFKGQQQRLEHWDLLQVNADETDITLRLHGSEHSVAGIVVIAK